MVKSDDPIAVLVDWRLIQYVENTLSTCQATCPYAFSMLLMIVFDSFVNQEMKCCHGR